MNASTSTSKKYADDLLKSGKDTYAEKVFQQVDEKFAKQSEDLDKKFRNERANWMKKVDEEAFSDQIARENDKDEVKKWVHQNYKRKWFTDDGL